MEYAYIQIIALLVTILALLYYYLQATFHFWTRKGVNGPKPIPIFGTIKDVFCSKLSMGSYLKTLYDEYKNDKIIGFFMLREPAVVLRDLDLIKDVLIKDFPVFSDRHVNVFEKVEPFSAHLFKLETARWRPLRTKFTPIFTSGKLKDTFHLLLESGDRLEIYLNELLAKSSTVECKELTVMYTIEVIGSFAFGIEMDAIGTEACNFRRMSEKIFRSDMKTYMRDRFSDLSPWLYSHFGYCVNDWDVVDFFVKITKEMIQYRKTNNVHRADFIEVLIDLYDNPEKIGMNQLTDHFMTAQAFVFFAAGHETSSTTITNTLYELAQNHDVQDKLRAEIDEMYEKTGGIIKMDYLKDMKYLDMVFKEVLRKHPVVLFLSRKSMSSYTFNGTKVTIPRNHKVFIPAYAIHRDPNIYPDPDKFDPNRFSDENVRARHPMSFLSFGNGPRNCIGARFATLQSKIGIIKIIHKHKVDVCDKTVIPYEMNAQHPLLLQPKSGSIYLKVTKVNETVT